MQRRRRRRILRAERRKHKEKKKKKEVEEKEKEVEGREEGMQRRRRRSTYMQGEVTQCTRWQARPLTGSSLFHSSKNSKALLIPYREFCTHNNLHGISSLYSGYRNWRLRESNGRA